VFESEAEVSPNLLATKLYIPPRRKNLVSRPRLIQTLHSAWQQDKKLILVSASAGYGKTTLVTEWLAALTQDPFSKGTGVQAAWLSLEKADNDPVRFLAYLIAALQQVEASIGENTRGMLQSPQPLPPDILLTSLVNEIACLPKSFILALDDYHVIESMVIHQMMDFLEEHLPPPMHLVMMTREDPALPLARLRARGQMAEIRQDDLRFTPPECADFLKRVMGLDLSAEDVMALERRTEGWITGLQLAALSMQGRADLPGFVEAFTGGSHYILDYLVEEVFEQQPADVQDFLLKTSILERLCGPLCDRVAERTGSQNLLERLEHANLFIVPLDQSLKWYRYHHLFAELLRQRLRITETISEKELHRGASRWFAAEGYFPEAIQHALAAADWEMAARLISSSTENMLRSGELATLLGWINALPDEEICRLPQLCRDYGWALSLTAQLDAADTYLQRAEAAAQGDDALLGTILVAQAYNLRVRGDDERAIERARGALLLLPEADHLSRGLVALTLGLIQWNRGNLLEAERAFLEVDRAALQSRNHYARMSALTYLAMLQAVYGRLHRSAELCQELIELGGESPTVAPAYIERGAILYEWNDLAEAERTLQFGIELSRRSGNIIFLSEGLRTLAILQQMRGEPAAAQSTLQKSDQFLSERQVTPLTRMRNAACHVQLALAQNDLEAATYWAGLVTEPADSSQFYPHLDLASSRLLLARGEKSQAAKKLKGLSALASQAGWGSGAVEVCALQALAAETSAEALHFLEEALQKAQPEGFMRTFLDKGEPLRVLLERLRPQAGELKGYLLSILSAFGEAGGISSPPQLIEPLSEREREVLRLMVEGMSNGEIADRLVIGIGTAKSHVHHILEKLGCSSRLQAVAKAREVGLQ
jgi:LuxR family transcriptional regulator, maltose regulon positive regulatory protein